MPSSSAGPAEQARGALDLAGAEQLADPARGDAFDERHAAHVEAEPLEQREIAGPRAPEAEVRAGDDHFRADRPQHGVHELLRGQLRQLEVELHHERLLDARLVQKLEPPLEGGEQLDVVAERNPRMRFEGDHRRGLPGRLDSVEHATVPEMNPVEGADRDGTRPLLQLLRLPCDFHEGITVPSTATSSPS